LTLGERRARLAAVAAVAASIAGGITAIQLTLDDLARPGRGGIEGPPQRLALSSASAFAAALFVGALLSVTLSPSMARRGGAVAGAAAAP
jgi:hypothetical protein